MWPKIILLCKQIIFNLKYCNKLKMVLTSFSKENIFNIFLEGHYFLDILYNETKKAKSYIFANSASFSLFEH